MVFHAYFSIDPNCMPASQLQLHYFISVQAQTHLLNFGSGSGLVLAKVTDQAQLDTLDFTTYDSMYFLQRCCPKSEFHVSATLHEFWAKLC